MFICVQIASFMLVGRSFAFPVLWLVLAQSKSSPLGLLVIDMVAGTHC